MILLFKLILYLTLLLVILIMGLKLWLQPYKGVCKCSAQLKGRVALVTGGNSGLGLETARMLANRGATVVIASRDAKKSQDAVADIISTTGNPRIDYKHLDLAKFSSIRKFVADFNQTFDRLDILVNNAGCAGLRPSPTEDGIEKVMQINYLGAFLLTNLLLDKLKASKPSRIVNVSSLAHIFAKFDPDDVAGLKTKGYFTRYANSKLCQVLWTKALARRLPDGVTANVLHPGVVKTEIFNRLPPRALTLVEGLISLLFKTAREGAQTSVHLCVAPELEHATGGYYDECRPGKESKLAKDDKLIEKVWINSELLTQSNIH